MALAEADQGARVGSTQVSNLVQCTLRWSHQWGDVSSDSDVVAGPVASGPVVPRVGLVASGLVVESVAPAPASLLAVRHLTDDVSCCLTDVAPLPAIVVAMCLPPYWILELLRV